MPEGAIKSVVKPSVVLAYGGWSELVEKCLFVLFESTQIGLGWNTKIKTKD